MSTSLALADAAPKCFSTSFDKGQSDIHEVHFLDNNDDPRVTFTFWGIMGKFVLDKLDCTTEENSIQQCYISCSSTGLSFGTTQDGHLFLNYVGSWPDYVSPNNSPFDQTPGWGNPDLDVSFLLAPDKDAPNCDPPDDAGNGILRAGDLSPNVEAVERSLGNLGFPAPNSSWIFTSNLSIQLAQYQKSRGLPVTGTLDTNTFDAVQQEAYASGDEC